MIEVFEIDPGFSAWSIPFIPVSIGLLVVFFLLGIATMAISAFENMQLGQKVLQFIVSAILITLWPTLLLTVKEVVDAFNTFLIERVFRMDWEAGLGAPFVQQILQGFAGMNLSNFIFKIINAILSVAIIASQGILHALFLVFFFLYAAMGPIVIAWGVFSEQLGVFIHLAREVVVLLLWQTTFVIIMGLMDTGYASTSQFLFEDESFFLQSAKAIVLIVLVLFVPAITRRFTFHTGPTFITPRLRWSGAALGAAAIGWASKRLLGKAAATPAAAATTRAGKESLRPKLRRQYHRTSEFLERSLEEGKKRELTIAKQQLQTTVQRKIPIPPPPPKRPPEPEEPSETSRAPRPQKLRPQVVEDDIYERRKIKRESIKTREPETRPSLQHIEISEEPEIPTAAEPRKRKPKPTKAFEKLKGLFRPSPKTPEKQRIRRREEKEKIEQFRGPEGSEKYHDIERTGVIHLDPNQAELDDLRAYRKRLQRFHQSYAWMYDQNGHFIGPTLARPGRLPEEFWGDE